MTIILDGTAGLQNNATDLSYIGTLTGGTGVVNLGSGQVYKDASGNVGIGTSSPASTLQVVGPLRFGAGPTDATNATMSVASQGTGISIEAFQGNSVLTKRDLYLAAYGGNVGIGNISPTEKLDVSGNIVASGSIKAASLAATTTLTDTTLRTYAANTIYTLPGNVSIVSSVGESFLVTLVVQYDNVAYHNWMGAILINMTYWNAYNNNSQWSVQMSTHVNGNPILTVYDTTGTGSRPIAFSLNNAITVTTGGFVKAIVTRVASF